jgi:hypothetical protein
MAWRGVLKIKAVLVEVVVHAVGLLRVLAFGLHLEKPN